MVALRMPSGGWMCVTINKFVGHLQLCRCTENKCLRQNTLCCSVQFSHFPSLVALPRRSAELIWQCAVRRGAQGVWLHHTCGCAGKWCCKAFTGCWCYLVGCMNVCLEASKTNWQSSSSDVSPTYVRSTIATLLSTCSVSILNCRVLSPV